MLVRIALLVLGITFALPAHASSTPLACRMPLTGGVAFFPKRTSPEVLPTLLHAHGQPKIADALKPDAGSSLRIDGKGFSVCVDFVSDATQIAYQIAQVHKREKKLRGTRTVAIISYAITQDYTGPEIDAKTPMGGDAAVPWELLMIVEALNRRADVTIYDFVAHDFYPKD